jgi:hypothetical protein
MPPDPIPGLTQQVDPQRLRANLFYLSQDPLPYRKLNHTLPGHAQCTLYEADDFIQAQLESWGYQVEKEGCPVQCFRCDLTKPAQQYFSPPLPDDPWQTAYNLYAKKVGTAHPDEIVIVISHKDSQSWIDSPGAYDNTVGTIGNLEIARILSRHAAGRSIWFIYCNEEHTPWTSMTAAKRARERGDHIVAVFNIDGIGGKGQAAIDAGRKTNVARYSAPEGKWLADLMAEVNDAYHIGLIQSTFFSEKPNDDDGSYVKEGFPAAIAIIGSFPYADPNYHMPGDRPEVVDLENVTMAVRATLAAIVRVADGRSGPA